MQVERVDSLPSPVAVHRRNPPGRYGVSTTTQEELKESVRGSAPATYDERVT